MALGEGRKMANTYKNREADAVICLLKRIYQGEDPRLLRKEANGFITDVDPKDISAAEQNLIDDGYSAQTVQQLLATFMLMGIPDEQSDNPRGRLGANHILQTVMVEHDLIRCFLADLHDVVGAIGRLNCLSSANSEFRKLAHITEHLNAMKEHIEREEDVIFPCLRKHGWMSSSLAVEGDHISITGEINNLVRLVISVDKVGFEQFRVGLTVITRCLSRIMLEHLFEEDEILYPVALGRIKDARVWAKMKAVCDEIGYCGVHL